MRSSFSTRCDGDGVSWWVEGLELSEPFAEYVLVDPLSGFAGSGTLVMANVMLSLSSKSSAVGYPKHLCVYLCNQGAVTA